jgi:hypothetical protein
LLLGGVAGNIGLSAGRIGGAAGFSNASYSENENSSRNQRIGYRPDSRDARPPTYLAIVLSLSCACGFFASCVGLEGRGHPFYLFGGWIIAAVSGCMLIWWWV